MGTELGRAVPLDRRPHARRDRRRLASRSTTGDVVIVSHQLPIWMVHRRLAGSSPLRTTRAAAAARSRASRRFERRGGRFVEVGYTEPGGRSRRAGRRPGSGVMRRPVGRRRRSRAGSRHPSLLLTGCASDPLAEQYREGSGKNYIAGDGTITEYAADDRGEPIEFDGETVEGGEFDSADDRAARSRSSTSGTRAARRAASRRRSCRGLRGSRRRRGRRASSASTCATRPPPPRPSRTTTASPTRRSLDVDDGDGAARLRRPRAAGRGADHDRARPGGPGRRAHPRPAQRRLDPRLDHRDLLAEQA